MSIPYSRNFLKKICFCELSSFTGVYATINFPSFKRSLSCPLPSRLFLRVLSEKVSAVSDIPPWKSSPIFRKYFSLISRTLSLSASLLTKLSPTELIILFFLLDCNFEFSLCCVAAISPSTTLSAFDCKTSPCSVTALFSVKLLILLFFIASFQTVLILSADSSFTTCVAISLLLSIECSAKLSFSPNTAFATIGDNAFAVLLSIPSSKSLDSTLSSKFSFSFSISS